MPTRTIAVQRFDPGADRTPYRQNYSVDIPDHHTVLDALLAIADTIDPSLAFRRTCRSGICGACPGAVNGQSCLLCQAVIRDVSRRETPHIVVEPLPGFQVLRDLVVEMDAFFHELRRVSAWLLPNPDYDGMMTKETVQQLWSATTCVLCGICASAPPTATDPHPAALVRVLRLAHDPRDRLGPARLVAHRGAELDGKFAEQLKTVCPKHVDVTSLVQSSA